MKFLLLLPLAVLAGCATGQTENCEAYLACQEAIDEQTGSDGAGALQATYGPEGTCWMNASTAASCDAGCVAGIQAAQGSVDPLPEECE